MNIETSDIVFAATMKVKGCKLQHIEKVGNRGIFHFVDVPESIVNDFSLGACLVEPVSHNDALKALTTSVKRIL